MSMKKRSPSTPAPDASGHELFVWTEGRPGRRLGRRKDLSRPLDMLCSSRRDWEGAWRHEPPIHIDFAELAALQFDTRVSLAHPETTPSILRLTSGGLRSGQRFPSSQTGDVIGSPLARRTKPSPMGPERCKPLTDKINDTEPPFSRAEPAEYSEYEESARDQALSELLMLGQRLGSSGSGGERRSERGPDMASEESDALFKAIETEIIPRLMLAHQVPTAVDHASEQPVREEAPDPSPSHSPPIALERSDHEAFLELLMNDSEEAMLACVESLVRRGIARETIFVELLGGAARRLGELWEEDLCDFSDVTIGLCRLHTVLRKESVLFGLDGPGRDFAADKPSILLTTGSGDQHVFGIVLVGEFFRRAGWQVWSEPGASLDHLHGLLASRHFDVVGMSVACSSRVDDVKAEVEGFRKASRNEGVQVLVGGRLFAESPHLADVVEADAVSCDAREAPRIAEAILARSGGSLVHGNGASRWEGR